MTRAEYRPELPPAPPRIAALPLDERGYPVPWFVAVVDGKPDHRIADGAKFARALNQHRCWICGDILGINIAFAIGPMCAVNRISGEPPQHYECAVYSARACPFLSRPRAHRRTAGLPDPDELTPERGLPILRNPGVVLVWVTRSYRLIGDGRGGVLVRIGAANRVESFAEGRDATSEELRESFDSGLPFLGEVAEAEGPEAIAALQEAVTKARALLHL